MEQLLNSGPYLFIASSGLILILINIFIVYFLSFSKWHFPLKVGLYTLIYTTLILVLKFIITPWNVYLMSERGPLEVDTFLKPSPIAGDISNIFSSGVSIALLYITIFSLLVLVISIKKRFTKVPKFITFFAVLALLQIICVPILFLSMNTSFNTPLQYVLIGVIPYLGAYNYIKEFTFLSFLSLPMIIASLYFASLAIGSAADQAKKTQQLAIFTSVIYLGLVLLIIYHGLWIVYFFLLTTYWPIKTVTPH